MKIKPSYIVTFTIALLLSGILLPIGLNALADNDFEQVDNISTYSAQDGNSTQTYTFVGMITQRINITVDYDDTQFRLNLTLLRESGTTAATDTTANTTLELGYTAPANNETFTISVEKLGITGTNPFVMIVNISTFPEMGENLNTLVKEVIPMVALVGIIVGILYVKKKQN